MSFVFEVSDELQRRVLEEAHRRHMAPQVMLDHLVQRGLETIEAPAGDDDIQQELAALKDRPVPQSLAELRPRIPTPPGMTAMQSIQGQWPGDETEEELLAALAADRARDRGLKERG